MAGRVSARLTPAEGRKFGFTVGIAFGVLAAVLYFWRHATTASAVLGSLSGFLLVGGLVAPVQLTPIERAWMKLAHIISKVTTPIFMAVVYFVVIAPVGIARRLMGKNALVRVAGEPPQTPAGYWVQRPVGKRQGDLSRQF